MRLDGSPPGRVRLLYVGDLTPGTTSAQRQRALQEIGCEAATINIAPSDPRPQRGLLGRVRRRLFGPRDVLGVNRQILELVRRTPYDAIWLDKALIIDATTFRAAKESLPRAVFIGYSPDDMYARHNQSPQFRAHLACYDVFFTTKSYGVQELHALGCRRAVFVDNAFDPHTHRPLDITAADRLRYGGPVGFVGTFERARGESMYHLASAGIPVRVWGNRWERWRTRHPNLRIEARALYGDEYALALNAFDINLCFLRKQNRDLQTTRTVEIPACGAFMLAERTDEQRALFVEDSEAAFFESDAELLAKTRYYLARQQERERIAAAGRARCDTGGYSYQSRLCAMLRIAGVLGGNVREEYPLPGTGVRQSIGCELRF